MTCGPKASCRRRQAHLFDSVCETVPAESLDAVLAREVGHTPRSTIDVVKLDMEGHECAALLSSLLPRYRPQLVLVEAQHPKTLRCIGQAARDYSYDVRARIPVTNPALGVAAMVPGSGVIRRCSNAAALCANLNLTAGVDSWRSRAS